MKLSPLHHRPLCHAVTSLPCPSSRILCCSYQGWNPQRMEAIVAKYVEPPREGYSLGLWLNLIGTSP